MAIKAGPIELQKGQVLFREGAESDSAYVIKSGKIAITKAKGSSEIILAELGPGSMLGEMAFFDNRPRSAGAKAVGTTVVIALPFAALHAQFKTFPEWLKVMVKTINSHLRDANQRIKNLEHTTKESDHPFDQHTITRMTAILVLVATRFGEKDPEGTNVPTGTLRRYTIQIFQQPTSKMIKLTEKLSELGLATLKDLGEGRQKLVLKDLQLLGNFVDYYNEYLFTEESKQVSLEEFEIPIVKAVLFYAEKKFAQNIKNPDGTVTVDLTQMQNESMKDLGEVVKVELVDSVITKGFCSDKFTGPKGEIMTKIDVEKTRPLITYWILVYQLLKVKN